MNTKSFRTVSIIMIVFGILGAVGGVASLGMDTGAWAVVLGIVNNLLLAVAGFIGTSAVKTGDEDKAALCKKLSFALLALAVINIVASVVVNLNTTIPGASSGLVMGMVVINGIVSLILPVLYFLGAKKFGE